jgi:hypothetical protein
MDRSCRGSGRASGRDREGKLPCPSVNVSKLQVPLARLPSMCISNLQIVRATTAPNSRAAAPPHLPAVLASMSLTRLAFRAPVAIGRPSSLRCFSSGPQKQGAPPPSLVRRVLTAQQMAPSSPSSAAALPATPRPTSSAPVCRRWPRASPATPASTAQPRRAR